MIQHLLVTTPPVIGYKKPNKTIIRGKNLPLECLRRAPQATQAAIQWMNTDAARHHKKIWYHIPVDEDRLNIRPREINKKITTIQQ